MEGLHEFVAHAEGALGAGPHGELAVGPFGHGGARLERRVGDVFDGVAVLELDVGGGDGVGNGAGRRAAVHCRSPGSGLFFRYSKRPSLEGCGGHSPPGFDGRDGAAAL